VRFGVEKGNEDGAASQTPSGFFGSTGFLPPKNGWKKESIDE